MKLQNMAAIATIIGTVIAIITYFSPGNASNTIDSLPAKKISSIEEAAEHITPTLNIPIYKGERNWLAVMYNASLEMPSYSAQIESLLKVTNSALSIDDYNMALLAAEKMPSYSAKTEALNLVVNQAIQKSETINYAYYAAKQLPSYSSQQNALTKVIDASSSYLSQANSGSTSKITPNEVLKVPASQAGTSPTGAAPYAKR